MEKSGISRQFILVCVAVLLAAYGVGLGVRKVRFAGVEEEASPVVKSDEPKAKAAGADASAKPESTSGPGEEVAQEAGNEEPNSPPERPGGRRMRGEGMRDRFANMSEEERQEAMSRMRERFGGRRRGGEGSPFSQLSEEDREQFRADMEALRDRSEGMTDEEREQARNEIFEKYGITPGQFGGRSGGRRSGAAEGEPPPKGRACFVGETPVWVDGKLIQIAKVTAGQTVGRYRPAALPLEQVQEHEGTFECRDIVLESGNIISVVDAHCFMLDSGRWVAAQNLTSGLRLKTPTGAVGIKSAAKRIVPYAGKVYNLKVRGSDRYLVGKDALIVRDY